MRSTRFDSHLRLGTDPRPPRRPLGARPVGPVALVVALMAVLMSGLAATAGPAAAADGDDPVVIITGRGWGHGRGMGQYGALGYARDEGWSSAQILDHFYGGTTSGPAPLDGPVDPERVRVDLVHLRGGPTTVALADGTIHLMDAGGATLARYSGAVRLTPVGGTMEVATALTCSGPWTPQPTLGHALVRVEAESVAAEREGLLAACGASRTTWYDGEIWAATTSGGSPRTINLVTVEEYLRGVVPNEVPASWPAATLQAQAVAARSYVLAGDRRWSGYADTCDTTQCQVYDGRYTTRNGLRRASDPRTDAAITATSGLVRLRGDGTVARTEFSSSTGGWTAGGDFPAVVDRGDAVVANPNATWQTAVDLSAIERSYGLGAIVGLAVTERNGRGADGGRVKRVELRFERGSVHLDGDVARVKLGLKSNWFSIGNLTRRGVVQEPIDGQLIDRYVDRVYRELVGRAPTGAEVAQARRVVLDGSRLELASSLVRREHFAGRLVDELYVKALGRPAEAEGRSYWVETMAGGLTYTHLGTLFYGSPEYVNRSGGTHRAFVDSLYEDVLGRAADAGGRSYWVGLLDRGQARPEDVAYAFYVSVESRRDRARDMHRAVLGTDAGPSLVERLAQRLLTIDDLTLAAQLAVDLDLEDP